MEWFNIGILAGMLFCAINLGAGILIGRIPSDKRINNTIGKNMDERADVSNNSDISDICNGDRNRSSNSTNNQRMDNEREITKYVDGKITNEYSKVVLEIMLIMMKNTLSATEKDAIQCAIDVLKLN